MGGKRSHHHDVMAALVAAIRAAVEGYWGERTAAVEGEAALQAYWEEGIHHADAEPAERQERHTPARRRLGSP